MALRKFILAGVPEQVNIPILLGLERQLFRKYGVELEYKIVPEVHSLCNLTMLLLIHLTRLQLRYFIYRVRVYYWIN